MPRAPQAHWLTLRRRWWLWAPPLLVLLLAALVLSRSPATALSPPPAAADVRAARELYRRVREAQATGEVRRVQASWPELAAAASLAGRTGGFGHVAFAREDSRGHFAISVPLPLGFWINAQGWIEPDDAARVRVSGRIGLLPVPAFLTQAGIGLTRGFLRLRNAEIPPLDTMVSRFSLDDRGLAADLRLPDRTRIVSTLGSLGSGAIDAQRVEQHYCRLVTLPANRPGGDLSALVRHAFAGGSGDSGDNRAVFVALSMLVAGIDAGILPDEQRKAITDRCGRPASSFQLLGRHDLALHWTVSTALASGFGAQASISLGTWKEIADSGAGGSGFSMVDLAADRSGTFWATRAADATTAAAVRDWLAKATSEDLLPLSALALAEGMSEEEFRSRYASTDSDGFADAVRRIDATLAAVIRF